MGAAIVGVGAALPEHVITNAEFRHLDADEQWIVKRTGIRERRWLPDDGSLAGLATQASMAALADAGVPAAAVGHVVVATITPDRVTPGVAVEVAARLGLPQPAAFDLNAACAGFLYALDHASALIETGRAQHVLICGADALSRITDRTDRSTAVLLGDGAGAVLVADVPETPAPSFALASDGAHIGVLYADRDERKLRMQGREVYELAVEAMTRHSRLVLKQRGLDAKDVDLFVAHQANARIVQAVARQLDLPDERVMINVDRVANTSAASIPIALEQARREGLLGPTGLLGMAAFGAGITWGAGVMGWSLSQDRAAA
jgi:3-oxoacyl-[acyl-carrier-protein] synthase-3